MSPAAGPAGGAIPAMDVRGGRHRGGMPDKPSWPCPSLATSFCLHIGGGGGEGGRGGILFVRVVKLDRRVGNQNGAVHLLEMGFDECWRLLTGARRLPPPNGTRLR